MPNDQKPPPLRTFSNEFPATPFAPRTRTISESHAAVGRMIEPTDLSVVFQPIVELDPLRIFAHEALVRCKVPAFKNPTLLFEHAVATSCAGLLGRMIREVAVPLCEGVPLFVNVHPMELTDRWIVRPDDPMFAHDHDVYIEVTESVPLLHFDLCRDVLNEIRTRSHVWFVVDDFGAGFSNLKRILDLEPKIVKLDRELVAGAVTGSRQQVLMKGVVRLCADLGVQVVAEGIETAEELRAVRDAGVRYGQGYLLARPGFPLPGIDPAVRKL